MTMRISPLIYIFLLLVLYPATGMAQSEQKHHDLNNKDNEHIFVAAHRADWIYAPENSIKALQNAISFGADIIETDVRMTRDGNIIMMHDATVDRTTTGEGRVADLTLEEIKQLRLRTNWGQSTQLKVPTLEEYILCAKGKAYLYFDKAGIEPDGCEQGTMVRAILQVLRKHNALKDAIFVLNWPYDKARNIFGTALDSVIYCPVIEDKVPHLAEYVNEYIQKLKPAMFQFRIASLDSESYRLLPYVLERGSRAFVAATWPHHTAGHDDEISILKSPSLGWKWLIEQGFSVLETNYPRDLILYLNKDVDQ